MEEMTMATNPEQYRRLIEKLSGAQNHRCAYCQRPMIIHHLQDEERGLSSATLEHVVAKTHGGSNKEENLVAACKLCNSLRRNELPR